MTAVAAAQRRRLPRRRAQLTAAGRLGPRSAFLPASLSFDVLTGPICSTGSVPAAELLSQSRARARADGGKWNSRAKADERSKQPQPRRPNAGGDESKAPPPSSAAARRVIQTVPALKGLPSHGCWDSLRLEASTSAFVESPGLVSMQPRQRRSLPLWCNLVVYFNSTNLSKKLQNTRMERTQDSQFFLLFLLFVYIVSSHGDYSYIQ